MLHRNNTWNGNTYSSSVWRKLTVNGVTVYDRTEAITVPPQANGYVCIVEGQTTVTHNSDGSKTVEVGFQSVDNVSAYFNCGWTSGTLSLATIPRTSSGRFDKTTYTIGDPIRINFTRGSASFTHEGLYSIPGSSRACLGWRKILFRSRHFIYMDANSFRDCSALCWHTKCSIRDDVRRLSHQKWQHEYR